MERAARAEELEAAREFLRDALTSISLTGSFGSPMKNGYGLRDGVDRDELRVHLRRLLSERPVPASDLGLEATIYADLVGARFEDWAGDDEVRRAQRLDALLAEGAQLEGRSRSSSRR